MISSVSGIVSESGTNLSIGSDTLIDIDSGVRNLAIGISAGADVTSASDSVYIGHNAGLKKTAGGNNVVIGSLAFDAADSGEGNNVVVGKGAGGNINASGSDDNVIIGNMAGIGGAANNFKRHIIIGSGAVGASTITDGGAHEGDILAIGYNALAALTTGAGNIGIGYSALLGHTTGSRNIAIGYGAMDGTAEDDAPTSIDNIFIGYDAGGGSWDNGADDTDDSNYNIGIGNYAMDAAMDGAVSNVAIGHLAGSSVTTAGHTVLIGHGAGDGLTTAGDNVAIGYYALSGVAGYNNVAVGYRAGVAVTGAQNVVLGNDAMYTATAVDSCVSIGFKALYTANEDDADGTIAIGYQAGYLSAPTGGASAVGANTLIGYSVGVDLSESPVHGLTTGIQNTIVGHEAFGANCGNGNDITGTGNTAMGYRAGYVQKTSSSYNSLFGSSSGLQMTTGYGNTFVGAFTGENLSTGQYNTCIGYNATAPATGNYQVSLGHRGGIKMATVRWTLTSTGYQGTPADGDAAHDNALIIIPPYSYIRRVYATVMTLSAGTADFQLSIATATDIAGGAAVTGATGGVELLGAGAAPTHWVTRSQVTPAGQSDINASSDDTAKVTWVSVNQNANSSTGWVGSSGAGLYLCHAGTNDTSDPGTDAKIQFTVEYSGMSE